VHIHEVVLAGSTQGIIVLSVGAAATVAGTALGLRKMDYERVPRVAMLSAAFFVVSVVQIQLGPASVHLVLNGLVGLILGWAAFPALLIALLLQAVFFSEGGLIALGLNTLTMALPGVVCYYLFHRPVGWQNNALAFSAGLAAGATGVILAGFLTAAALWVSGEAFRFFAGAVLAVNLALAVVEGFITGSAVMFLRKVRPELLDAPLVMPNPES
jgi:cobalt/nickel transport system permease protein